jgi:hypothetical protein
MWILNSHGKKMCLFRMACVLNAWKNTMASISRKNKYSYFTHD